MEAKTSTNSLVQAAEQVFARYVRTHQEFLKPDGIFCKRNAVWLAASIGKRVPDSRVAIGRVNGADANVSMTHLVGGEFNYHYVVLFQPEGDGEDYVFDPLLFPIENAAVPASDYLETAFSNAESLFMSEVTL